MEYFDNIQAMDSSRLMINGWWVTHEYVKQLSGWLPGEPTKGTAGAYREGEITNAQGLCEAGFYGLLIGWCQSVIIIPELPPKGIWYGLNPGHVADFLPGVVNYHVCLSRW